VKTKIIPRYGVAGAIAAGMKTGSVMTVAFEIEGYDFVALNGGPLFEITPSISFFVNCNTAQEINDLWKKLSQGGTVMMELGRYPFSERYGWIQDKFGVSWQLILDGRKQKIAPCLMFAGAQHKKAEEAIHFYQSIFKDSHIILLERYPEGQGPEGGVVHARFTLQGQEFVAMNSHMEMPFDFNPAVSMVVYGDTQGDIDYYWERLSEGGDERAQQCGWMADKYGVSWQIVPSGWDAMMRDADPLKMERLMGAVLQMKKIDLAVVLKAYNEG